MRKIIDSFTINNIKFVLNKHGSNQGYKVFHAQEVKSWWSELTTKEQLQITAITNEGLILKLEQLVTDWHSDNDKLLYEGDTNKMSLKVMKYIPALKWDDENLIRLFDGLVSCDTNAQTTVQYDQRCFFGVDLSHSNLPCRLLRFHPKICQEFVAVLENVVASFAEGAKLMIARQDCSALFEQVLDYFNNSAAPKKDTSFYLKNFVSALAVLLENQILTEFSSAQVLRDVTPKSSPPTPIETQASLLDIKLEKEPETRSTTDIQSIPEDNVDQIPNSEQQAFKPTNATGDAPQVKEKQPYLVFFSTCEEEETADTQETEGENDDVDEELVLLRSCKRDFMMSRLAYMNQIYFPSPVMHRFQQARIVNTYYLHGYPSPADTRARLYNGPRKENFNQKKGNILQPRNGYNNQNRPFGGGAKDAKPKQRKQYNVNQAKYDEFEGHYEENDSNYAGNRPQNLDLDGAQGQKPKSKPQTRVSGPSGGVRKRESAGNGVKYYARK